MNKYIIYAEWLVDYIMQEPYVFIKTLEKYGWNSIPLGKVNYEYLNNAVVLFVTYDNVNIAKFKSNKNKIIYKVDDLFPMTETRRKCIEVADLIIGPYQYHFEKLFTKNSLWIPYSAIPTFYSEIEFNSSPINKIFVSGALAECYPLRNYISTNSNYEELIEKLPHPGYNASGSTVNKIYYKNISRYICGFCDASSYQYIMGKIFEIPSVGSLLLVEDTLKTQLNILGFVDMKTCIMCNKENLLEKINWILDIENRIFVDNIRKSGMELVRLKHNTFVRSEFFNFHLNKDII